MPPYIVVTTDDLRPETQELFEKYFDKLKEKHPNLEVTAYIPAFYQEFGIKPENAVSSNLKFKKFIMDRGWITVAVHGLYHKKPPENLLSYEAQKDFIQSALRIMGDFLRNFEPIKFGYKAPFYRMDKNTLKVLIDLRFSWLSQWWYFIPLEVLKKPMPQFIEMPSHCGTPEQNNPDNIDKIFESMDKQLTEFEKLGFQYTTFDKIMLEAT